MNLSLYFYTIVDSLIHFYLFLDLLFILIIYSFLFIFSFECQDTVKCDGWDYDLSMGLTTVSIACVADDIGDIDNIGYFVIVGRIVDNIGDIGIGHIGDIFGARAWKMEVKSLYLVKNENFQSSKI